MTLDADRNEDLLLDGQLPRYQARLFTAVLVDAHPERTYAAVRALDPDQVARSFPAMTVLGRLRALPALLARRGGRQPAAPDALSADQASEAFVPLAEEPGSEFVIGMIGKFMTVRQLEFRRFEPGDFAAFADPGFGKVALNFRVRPYGAGASLLSTETRTATTDERSGALFRRYWRVVGPFAGLIMRRWLRVAKQHAESEGTAPTTAVQSRDHAD